MARHPDTPDEGSDRSSDPDYPAVLHGKSPRVVLARLLHGDPLGIHSRAQSDIDAAAVLVDPTRLYLRAAARVAFDALRWRGRSSLEDFLAKSTRRALRGILDEDREYPEGAADDDTQRDRYGFVCRLLGIDKSKAHRLCVLFNGLPKEQRAIWRAIHIEGHSLGAYCAREEIAMETGQSRLDAAVAALLAITPENQAQGSLLPLSERLGHKLLDPSRVNSARDDHVAFGPAASVRHQLFELAWLLKEACMQSLIEGCASPRVVGRYFNPSAERHFLARNEFAERLSRLRVDAPSHPGLGIASLTLERFTRQGGRIRPTASELATCVMQIAPSDVAEWMIATADFAEGRPRMALARSLSLVARTRSPRVEGLCYQVASCAFAHLGEYWKAHELILRSVQLPNAEHYSVLNRMLLVVQAGLEDQVADASTMVEDMVPSDGVMIEDFVSLVQSSRAAGMWAPSTAAGSLAPRLQDRLRGTSRRLVGLLL